jgi:hypothetical protein
MEITKTQVYTQTDFTLGSEILQSFSCYSLNTHDTANAVLQLASVWCVELQDKLFDWLVGLD